MQVKRRESAQLENLLKKHVPCIRDRQAAVPRSTRPSPESPGWSRAREAGAPIVSRPSWSSDAPGTPPRWGFETSGTRSCSRVCSRNCNEQVENVVHFYRARACGSSELKQTLRRKHLLLALRHTRRLRFIYFFFVRLFERVWEGQVSILSLDCRMSVFP